MDLVDLAQELTVKEHFERIREEQEKREMTICCISCGQTFKTESEFLYHKEKNDGVVSSCDFATHYFGNGRENV